MSYILIVRNHIQKSNRFPLLPWARPLSVTEMFYFQLKQIVCSKACLIIECLTSPVTEHLINFHCLRAPLISNRFLMFLNQFSFNYLPKVKKKISNLMNIWKNICCNLNKRWGCLADSVLTVFTILVMRY